MPARFPVPIQEDVRDLLHDLLGRGIAVDKISALALEEDERAVVAAYRTDTGELAALCVVDGAFAVRAGAALSMVPNAVAQEAIDRNELPDTLLDNLREVVNIFSRFLNSAKTPHVKLAELVTLPGELPAEVASLMASPAFRRDFAVAIEGYGNGRFTLLVS